MACTLAVMLQTSGKVCDGNYKDSHVLRCSPFICAADTLMILVKFAYMLVFDVLSESQSDTSGTIALSRMGKKSPALLMILSLQT